MMRPAQREFPGRVLIDSVHVRFAPKATEILRCREMTRCARTGREQVQQTTRANAPLFDDLVGGGEQQRRHGEAEHPGSLEVDDQLELGWLLDWKLSESSTLHDTVDI